jgi:hypothetical protein
MKHSRMGAVKALAFTAVVAAAVVAGLSGCAISSETVHSRASFYEFLDTTQSLVGGDWDSQDDPTPRGCELSIWGQGHTYPGLRIGSSPSSQSHALAAVRSSWELVGFAVEQSSIGQSIELKGVGDRGEMVFFRVGSGGMTLSGTSACAPVAS